ncbi:hypothetical protein [Pelomonas cellulosilytica]|uniref:DUF4131 domain-containing protein n=1 Tax=Pelomonas cellulosilytica TaxID=2906762 RepID=A0ABS8XX37_9BURK|nr:hypothetical protein [Pelomonas sp. P8]MCE4557231.1 hypothetical protein [Pelomonas sp. P8]
MSHTAFAHWQKLSAPAAGFLVAAAVVTVLLAPEFFSGLNLRRSFEPFLWIVAAAAAFSFLWVVARAQWHWAIKTLALLGLLIGVLGLLLRILIASMSSEGPALVLDNGCSVQITRVGAFGDVDNNVERNCVVAALWMRRTALAHFDRESVRDLKLLPSKTPDVQRVAMTVQDYPKQAITLVLPLPTAR